MPSEKELLIERHANKVVGSTELRTVSGSPLYQIMMLVLSIYVLITLSISTFFIDNIEIKAVMQYVDLLVCLLFFGDFLMMFYRAPDKLAYMKWGWVDLVSSIPMVDPFRWGRLARIFRVIRVLRALKSLRVIYDSVQQSRFETLTMMMFIVVFFSFSISAGLILEFERTFESPIQTANDALWWALLSMLNAKSGVLHPVSPEGVLSTVYLIKIGYG
jgi:voltage-gated potassium channel